MRLTENPRRRTHETGLQASAIRLLRPACLATARREITSWPGYAPMPPVSLPGLALRAGVASIRYQDEGARFGVQSFKPWGGGYATAALVARRAAERSGGPVTTTDLLSGAYASVTADVTVTCATDGNHGLAVAWAAREFGGRAVVYLAEIVSDMRAARIAGLGAATVRSAGNHEVASAECRAAALEGGWYIITETENATEPEIARDTLAGYGALWMEALGSCEAAAPTHLFVQAGVGGLAATAAAVTAQRFGAERPTLAVVESEAADCIRRGLETGERVTIEGHFDTRLAGLAAGATSDYAWELLSAGADFGLAIDDDVAWDAVRALAEPRDGDPAIEAGGSGASGLGGALAACADPDLRTRLGIGPDARILVLGTEGATDPVQFEEIVGRPPRTGAACRGIIGSGV